jgi:pimeloyl-ACP methyl ester carboxylesterase
MATIIESNVDVGEFRVNVARSGRGEPLVMLHGSDSRESWRVWEPMTTALAESYSLLIPDMIGYGKSSKPLETPTYETQARVVHELLDKLGVERAGIMGSSWGGQVALEVAINWPGSVKNLVLIASSYDTRQVPKAAGIKIPTLILWAEDDMITQTKAAYLLRDTIGTSRLEVLDAVAKDPRQDFTIAHKLERYRSEAVREKVLRFLADPGALVTEPPELEPELKGLAMKEADREREKRKQRAGE